MNQDDNKSQIDELNKKLYWRGSPDIRTKRRFRFSDEDAQVSTDWEHPKEEVENIQLNKEYKNKTMSFSTKFLIFSIIVFILAVAAGLYIIFNGANLISATNIDININAPLSVAGGEPISFDIQVVNRNNIKLETVDLVVDYPIGSVDAIDTTKELKNFREMLQDISPGGIEKKSLQAVVYGEENSKKQIKVTIEYRVKGSTSVFQKERTFDFIISSSPLTLSINSYKEVNAGQEYEMELAMNSNSKEIIKNVLIRGIYPFGYSFISSDPAPFSGNYLWNIGDIPPNSKKVIKIKGKLDAQNDEKRTFRFIAGAQSPEDNKKIATEYISASQEISISKPFINVGVALDGDSESVEYVGNFNTPIKVDVSYFNNLSVPIIDGEIHATFSGNAFDKYYVSPGDGLYKSENKEIVWNSINSNQLKTIPAGGSGRVDFTITPRNNGSSINYMVNPDITMNISVKGNRNSENNVPESIVSTAKRHIKVATNVFLAGQVVRSSGPFDNLGPIPPKAENTTTYNIVLSVDNTTSSVSDAKVVATLPAYVHWLDRISPMNEDIKYNPVNGQLTWNIGSLGTNTLNGFRRQVIFQISVVPSVAQIGQVLDLVNGSTLTALDDFTNQTVSSNLNSLTTRYSTDPVFKDGDERVVN